MSAGGLTRGDFEALLWDYLTRSLDDGVTSELLDGLGITTRQWITYSDGEVAELQAAVEIVRADCARRVWRKEGDRR